MSKPTWITIAVLGILAGCGGAPTTPAVPRANVVRPHGTGYEMRFYNYSRLFPVTVQAAKDQICMAEVPPNLAIPPEGMRTAYIETSHSFGDGCWLPTTQSWLRLIFVAQTESGYLPQHVTWIKSALVPWYILGPDQGKFVHVRGLWDNELDVRIRVCLNQKFPPPPMPSCV